MPPQLTSDQERAFQALHADHAELAITLAPGGDARVEAYDYDPARRLVAVYIVDGDGTVDSEARTEAA